ncbi:MAG: ScyD/ScyE family protein, partial [Chthoniobacterales bacterium]
QSALTSIAAFAFAILAAVSAQAQCPVTELISGLQRPLGSTISNKNNLIVAESGTATPNSGRISIIDLTGNRRTLLAGLPSGIAVEGGGEPSGPSGVAMRGRTLYLAIGVGDAVLAGPGPGTVIPNPNPSSPLLSSVLKIHFSAAAEMITSGFTLSAADQQTLADGQRVSLSNGGGDKVKIELVANFPNSTPNPLPGFEGNVRASNPFALVIVANRLYVTDGGQNLVRQVNLAHGSFSTLVTFPRIPNPLPFGPPEIDAVPTGIVFSDGKLLVTLFRGFPFPPGSSTVEKVDPTTGSHSPLIDGLKTAIGVLPVTSTADDEGTDPSYLVLEHSSGNVLDGPGILSQFATPTDPPVVIANCLMKPTSMTLDSRTGTLYVTELPGRIVSIPVDAVAFDDCDSGVDIVRALTPFVRNTATRGLVRLGDDVMIAGFILGSNGTDNELRTVIRAIGPSLAGAGVAGTLQDPMLQLHDANGALIVANDNWKDTQRAELEASGLAPTNDRESAILRTLSPGNYTAIVRSVSGSTGVALVEVYLLN